jgi:acetyl esterase/lipase
VIGGVTAFTGAVLQFATYDLNARTPAGRLIADVLLQDNLAVVARLSASGADVDLRVYPDSPHGFTGHPTRMAQAALDDIHTWLRGRLNPAPRPG